MTPAASPSWPTPASSRILAHSRLVRHGLSGVELNHHAHSAADRRIIREYAAAFGLFMTGGSDFHGRYEPQLEGIGDILSDESGVMALCS